MSTVQLRSSFTVATRPRHGEVNEQQLIDLEMARNEPGTLKCTSGGVNVFKSWRSEKTTTGKPPWVHV